jgi:nucleoside phosphorylase
MYCLGAVKTPVVAADIKNALALHVPQKDLPPNITASLRDYVPLVRLVDKGPPLRWLLTDKGIERLRKQSGLPLPTAAPEGEYGIDVGIVCALEDPEFAAVIEAFGGPAAWQPVGDARYAHVYQACEISTARGTRLRVVGTTSTSMGLTAASIVTTQLVMQFRPRLVMMIGIAAGTRSSNKQFGDVLVADPSVDYNSGKVVMGKGVRDFQPDPYPIGLNARLRSVLHKYRTNNNVFAEIRANWNGKVPLIRNRVHVGPLGAADQVIDDASRVLEIQRNWRKLIGVEMETYGVYRACYEAPHPQPRFVSFKSVCDFAAEKSDSWQRYAAYMAAQFAFRFVCLDWEGLWPSAHA